MPIDLTGKGARDPIKPEDLAPHASRFGPTSFVLLCTGWIAKAGSSREYVYESPWLRVDGAECLISQGIGGVGIDHPSVSGMEDAEDLPTHRALLGAGVLILEGLVLPKELFEVPTWYPVASPLPTRDASGGPARVIAIELG